MLVPMYGFNLIVCPSVPRLIVITNPTVGLLPDVNKVTYWSLILVGSLWSVMPVTSKLFPSTTSENVSTRVSDCKFSEKLVRIGLLVSGDSVPTFTLLKLVMAFPAVSAKDIGAN